MNTHKKQSKDSIDAVCFDLLYLADKIHGNDYISDMAFTARTAACIIKELEESYKSIQHRLNKSYLRGEELIKLAWYIRRFGDTKSARMAIDTLRKIGADNTPPYEWDDIDTYGAASC